jgi:hypothetical protein
MADTSTENLCPRDAATYVNLAPATLAKIRCVSNDGPQFIRLGRKILYRKSDLDLWLEARKATSTSDADKRLPRRLTDAMPPG